MSLISDIEALNDDIENWNKKDLKDLRAELVALNVKHVKRSPNKVALTRALRSKLTKSSGLTNRISYIMPKSAIFLHKGVSKGHPITNPRKAKEWYSPVVNRNLEDLAEIVSEGNGNLIINNLDIK